jgi:Uri superfamily endonuclease
MATYILIIKLSRSVQVTVGKLGEILFKRGNYVYIGSAGRGLNGRIKRHGKKEKKCHWHIDYLLNHRESTLVTVWTKNANEECTTARLLLDCPGVRLVREGYGSSDCRCPAHLFWFMGGTKKLREYLIDLGFDRMA